MPVWLRKMVFALHVLLRLLAEAGKKALRSLWHLLEKSVINTD
jgi:hypothetical protein